MNQRRVFGLVFSALLLGVVAFLSSCGAEADPAASVDTASDQQEAADATNGAADSAAAEDDAATGDDTGSAPAEVTVVEEPPADDAEPAADDDAGDDAASADAEADEPDTGEAAEDDAMQPVVFNDDFSASVEPILAEKCAICHSAGGPGASHLVLATAQDLVDTHLLISDVVTTRYMPPWPASDLSVDFHDNRSLNADEVQAIIDWSSAGAPLDVPADSPLTPAAPIIGLADPEMVLGAPAPYAGDPNVLDDYRCQIYDPQLDEAGWITAYEFVPDQIAVAHHAIGYLLPASAMDAARSLDGSDGNPGWECYGSSGLGQDNIFLGWAPGQDPTVYPTGSGLPMAAGDFIVLQIHYHYEGEAPLDASTLAINMATPEDIAAAGGELDEISIAEFIAPVEIPCATWEQGPLCDRDAAMADALDRFGEEGVRDFFTGLCGYEPSDFAGMTDGIASSSCAIPAGFRGASGEIVAILGHMHEIGDWFRMTLNPGTPDEVILLDIPNWDFDWQYNYAPVDSIVLTDTDIIEIECGWDRTRRATGLPPAYILWADGTNDEMCFATVTVRK